MRRVWPAVVFIGLAGLVIIGVLVDYYIHTLSQETMTLAGGVLLGLFVGLAVGLSGLAVAMFALVVVVKLTLPRSGNGANYIQPQQIPPVFLLPQQPRDDVARYYGDGLEGRIERDRRIVVVGGSDD